MIESEKEIRRLGASGHMNERLYDYDTPLLLQI